MHSNITHSGAGKQGAGVAITAVAAAAAVYTEYKREQQAEQQRIEREERIRQERQALENQGDLEGVRKATDALIDVMRQPPSRSSSFSPDD